MKRYICLLAILTAIAALLCGCSLARSDMDASAASRDRLIGVYITTEYIDLFDLEGYIGANASALSGGSIGEADAAQYNGRLYAELVDERYVFPGVDGFAFFMATTEHEYGTSYSNYTDEGVCGGKIAVNTNDNEDSSGEALELECTIYGITGRNDRHVIYTNPVYQTADGEVYLTSGHGISTSGVGAGALVSQKLTDSTTLVCMEKRFQQNRFSSTSRITRKPMPPKIISALVTRLSSTSSRYGVRFRIPPRMSNPELLKAATEWNRLMPIACGTE